MARLVLTHQGGGGAGGSGDVAGPASSTDNAVARFDGAGGKTLQNSAVIISDAAAVSGITQLTVDNIDISGNTIASLDANGDVIVDPNGTGNLNVASGRVAFATGAALGAAGTTVTIFESPTSGNRGNLNLGTLNIDGNIAAAGSGGQAFLLFSVEANTAVAASPNLLSYGESRKVLTNEGTTAENYHTLPTAVAGLSFTFYCQDTDGIRIVAAAGDTIRHAATVSAAAGFIRCATVGNCVTLVAINATEWVVSSIIGIWTIDA